MSDVLWAYLPAEMGSDCVGEKLAQLSDRLSAKATLLVIDCKR